MHPDSSGEFLVYHSVDNYSTLVILFGHKCLTDFYSNMFYREYLINTMKSFYARSQGTGQGNAVKRQYFCVVHYIRPCTVTEGWVCFECSRASLTSTCPSPLLLKVWNIDPNISATAELVINTESQLPPRASRSRIWMLTSVFLWVLKFEKYSSISS